MIRGVTPTDDALVKLAVTLSACYDEDRLPVLLRSMSHVAEGCSLSLSCPYIQADGSAALVVTLSPAAGHRLVQLLTALSPGSEDQP